MALKQNFWHLPTGILKDVEAKKKSLLFEMNNTNNSHLDKNFNLITGYSKAL